MKLEEGGKMKVLFVGWVDRLVRETLENILGNAFDDLKIERIRCELMFRERLSTIKTNPVDLVFMEVKFPWTTIERLEKPPQDVVSQNYHIRAGFRCEKLLHKVAPEQPMILHSVGSAEEYKDEIAELPKTTKFIEDTYHNGMSSTIRRTWRLIRSQ